MLHPALLEPSLRVLIVEDSELDTRLMLRELEQGGYTPIYTRVETPEDLTTALTNQDWDVVLSDYAMPDFDGLSALQVLQDMDLDIPFILVSGCIGDRLAVDAMKAGAHDYLMKDNLARLVVAIEREVREASDRDRWRHMEVSLQETTQAQHQQEVQAQMLAMLTHQFKNPLGVIRSGLSLLEYYFALTEKEKHQRCLDRMRISTDSINYLLNGTLLMGQVLSGSLRFTPGKVALMPLCQNVIDRMPLDLGDPREIRLSGTGIPEFVHLDGTLLHHILSNLLSNAVKYSPPHSSVHLHVSYEPAHPEQRHPEYCGQVRFCIEDHGVGITPLDLEAICTPFQRGSNVGEIPGHGLGMALVKECVDRHQGQIEIESELGIGTTVTVILPIVSDFDRS
jgi:signal transduction histidine kinase